MEKINNFFKSLKILLVKNLKKTKDLFIKKKTSLTAKQDLDFKNVSVAFFGVVGLFLVLGMLMPSDDNRVFRQVAKDPPQKADPTQKIASEQKPTNSAPNIWGNGSAGLSSGQRGGSQVNYNTAMVIGSKNGNSRTELHAGTKIRLQIIDKFVASQEGTPVIAKSVEDVTSDSGNSVPKDSLFYGEASYEKSSGRAVIQFKKVSYPNGTIRDISASAVSSDGMSGLEGNLKSDSAKNSVGQVITTFVGGLAAGSVERDFMGNSKGGVSNGLLQAVSETARDRAQKYGESMKDAREWIEISAGTSCDAVIRQPFKMTESTDEYSGGR